MLINRRLLHPRMGSDMVQGPYLFHGLAFRSETPGSNHTSVVENNGDYASLLARSLAGSWECDSRSCRDIGGIL